MKVPRYLSYLQRWTLIGLAIGVISGLGAALFYLLLNLGTSFFLRHLASFHPPLPAGEGEATAPTFSTVRWWLLALVPGVGGLISGLMVYGLASEAEGHGTDAVIMAFHKLGGAVRKRI
ncbi:TPA: chloride channel protein, partial [Candidatus Bathyarchaeota archaeon]|nr:chloride channel protein [Candidatus Bathyarchaeota archaeon]